jgi:hypothetical protein
MDFSPTIVGCVAGEDIGIPYGTYTAADYPKAPETQPFNMLYMTANLTVKKMALGTSTTDKAKAQKYAGFTETAVRNGENLACRVAGQLWIPIGSLEVTYGELVVPEFSNASGNVAGSIIPFVDPASSDGPLTAGCHYASMIVGRALKGGTARTSATVFNLALVVLRGY